jgi:hypothetical protein
VIAIKKGRFPPPGVRVADPEVSRSTPSEPLAIPPLGRGQNRPQFPWLNPALAAARDFANGRLPLVARYPAPSSQVDWLETVSDEQYRR